MNVPKFGYLLLHFKAIILHKFLEENNKNE